MISKKDTLSAFIELIEKELESMLRAAEHARQSAISDEVKTQDKYDTQGLEASYLAGAQAKRAEDLRVAYNLLKRLFENLKENSAIVIEGSILTLLNEENESERTYIILPKEGGLKKEMNGITIYSLSSSSPLGSELIGRKSGENFEIEINNKIYNYSILELL